MMAQPHIVCSSQTDTTSGSLDEESYYRLRPTQSDCKVFIDRPCNAQCFKHQHSITSIPACYDIRSTMCFKSDDYEGYQVGHYHRAGEKVIRRHNGRLVVERLRRPLIHFNDGSELVGYHSRSRIHGRSYPIRLPMRVPGHGHRNWDGDRERDYGGPTAMVMPGGLDRYGMNEERMSGRCGEFGHGNEDHHGRGFPSFLRQHDQGHTWGQHEPHHHHHHNDRASHYTSNEGMHGRIENRSPRQGF